jgi:hypothetical protein
MESIHANIDSDIASLDANITKCRDLIEERRAHGHIMIAERLTAFVADLEARMDELEAMAKADEGQGGSVTAHSRHNGYE